MKSEGEGAQHLVSFFFATEKASRISFLLLLSFSNIIQTTRTVSITIKLT